MAKESKKLTEIRGGVTAPQGFRAAAIHCGIKRGSRAKPDLMLLCSEGPAVAAATFTANRIKAAPVRVSARNIRGTGVRAIIANSGNANACTGLAGIEDAKQMARLAAAELQLRERQVLVCSTGRIGVPLPMPLIERGIPNLAKRLSRSSNPKIAESIMTSDTFPKEVAMELRLGRRRVRIGGIAKGAGMIDPNMATMLCFLTTDARISKHELQSVLSYAVEESFNRITVDGDMSTNDSVIMLANGVAEKPALKRGSTELAEFQTAVNLITGKLARMIVEDGEGASKFVEVQVNGAATITGARKAANAIANSQLVKCAWYGGDPNWGRVLAAVGASSARVREEMVDIYYDGVLAVQNGAASRTPPSKLKKVVGKRKFRVTVDLHIGSAGYTVYTTDMTPEYVEYNKAE